MKYYLKLFNFSLMFYSFIEQENQLHELAHHQKMFRMFKFQDDYHKTILYQQNNYCVDTRNKVYSLYSHKIRFHFDAIANVA